MNTAFSSNVTLCGLTSFWCVDSLCAHASTPSLAGTSCHGVPGSFWPCCAYTCMLRSVSVGLRWPDSQTSKAFSVKAVSFSSVPRNWVVNTDSRGVLARRCDTCARLMASLTCLPSPFRCMPCCLMLLIRSLAAYTPSAADHCGTGSCGMAVSSSESLSCCSTLRCCSRWSPRRSNSLRGVPARALSDGVLKSPVPGSLRRGEPSGETCLLAAALLGPATAPNAFRALLSARSNPTDTPCSNSAADARERELRWAASCRKRTLLRGVSSLSSLNGLSRQLTACSFERCRYPRGASLQHCAASARSGCRSSRGQWLHRRASSRRWLGWRWC